MIEHGLWEKRGNKNESKVFGLSNWSHLLKRGTCKGEQDWEGLEINSVSDMFIWDTHQTSRWTYQAGNQIHEPGIQGIDSGLKIEIWTHQFIDII